jgi:hypothetical protein
MYDNPWYPEPVQNPQYQPATWWSTPKFFMWVTVALIAFTFVMTVNLLAEAILLWFCLMVITSRWRVTDMESEWPDVYDDGYPEKYSDTKDLGWK